jgi:hypothetical protein
VPIVYYRNDPYIAGEDLDSGMQRATANGLIGVTEETCFQPGASIGGPTEEDFHASFLPGCEGGGGPFITHIALWMRDNGYVTHFDEGQTWLYLASLSGFVYDLPLNPPWAGESPTFDIDIYPTWSENPPGEDNPLFPVDAWYPTLFIPRGVSDAGNEGRVAHALYITDEEPVTVSATVAGDIDATLVSVTELGAGTWFGRTGYGILVEFTYDTANDLPEPTDFAITIEVEAVMSSTTLVATSNILHKFVSF